MNQPREQHLPLAELVRGWLRRLLDQLGEHRVAGFYHLVLEQVEKVLIEEALARSGGKAQKAARLLDLHRNSLRARMRALGLGRHRHPAEAAEENRPGSRWRGAG